MDYELRHLKCSEINSIMVVVKSMHSEGVYKDYKLKIKSTRFILKELIKHPDVLTDGVYVNDTLVGIVVAETVQDLWADVNVVYDHAFYLLPEYRGGRRGLALLKRLDEWAVGRGVADMTRISVYAGVDNARVASILDKIGYTRSGSLHVKEHSKCVPA